MAVTDFERILQSVASEYGQQRHALLARSRGRKDVAEARQVARYLSHKLCPSRSLTAIGEFFGRDRTTVRHAFEKVGMRHFTADPKEKAAARRVDQLEKRLGRTIAPV